MTPQLEITVDFSSREEWVDFIAQRPEFLSPDTLERVVETAKKRGVRSRFFDCHIPPEEIRIAGRNYRESFLARGLTPRARAILDLVVDLPGAGDWANFRAFAPEALTPFALHLRGRYCRFLGSEYSDTPEVARRLFPIPNENLEGLSFPAQSFDAVICNDVFEHVANLKKSLEEIARVLRPGGTLLATFPFAISNQETSVRAVLLPDGSIEYLAEKEFHGNPLDPEGGSLVFQIPGWDILEMCRQSGLQNPTMTLVCSEERGIIASDLAGIILLRCTR